MKKTLLFLFLISTAFAGKGQNLVPNGDFEQSVVCPTGYTQLWACSFWINPASNGFAQLGTPDYFNACNQSIWSVGVPYNLSGYQPAHSDSAYAGLILWYDNYTFREYIEVPLTSSLISNTCYHFEMYVNLANSSKYSTNDIGVYFSDTLVYDFQSWGPLPFIPQIINSTGFITDTLNWTLVSGNYMAQGGESHLIIGNFEDDANTDTSIVYDTSAAYFGVYIYIDDVSLTLTPCTAIEEQNQNEAIKIHPSPAKDFINISFTSKEEKNVSVEMYDLLGRPLTPKGEPWKLQPDKEMKIDMRSFSNGIYIVEIKTGEEVYRKKVLKE